MSGLKTAEAAHLQNGDFLSGGGEMGALIRAKDWSRTPVGSPEQWPQSLRTALGILLDSGYPMYIGWGPEFTQFYNDAYRPILGTTKHPSALGESTRVTFAEVWDFIGPMFERVLSQGENTTLTDQLLPLNRHGFVEECYFTFSYSAIRAEGGAVGGVFVTVIETTQRVIAERRQRTLRDIGSQPGFAREVRDVCRDIVGSLAGDAADVPAALIYMRDPNGAAVLCASRGFENEQLAELQTVPPDASGPLVCFAEAANRGMLVRLTGDDNPFGRPSAVIPLLRPGGEPSGFLVVVLSNQLAWSESYESFLYLAAAQAAAALANAQAYADERKRAEALAELDRAKTTFFSNISHEFRTPLTLMMGPLEESLNEAESLPDHLVKNLDLAHRNSLRLLRLVNTLLDFSRIEAGRISACYEPVDLNSFTADIASTFRSAIERAGLRFTVDCSLRESVFADADMWEKIVLNLLSNAFKFTFEGEIAVRLTQEGRFAKLSVSDTGTGIPDADLPHVFERFHRSGAARGRSFEGSGIGLALVAEFVKLHGGFVDVRSTPDRGSTFTVSLPLGSAHLPVENVRHAARSAAVTGRARAFLDEADAWLLPNEHLAAAADKVPRTETARADVLIVDDNADMRRYLQRILEDDFQVRLTANGEEALAAIGARAPALVLSDVMMPKLDGIGLVRKLRENPALSSLPVILLSARVGEDARLEGLNAGADDYLQKPFSSREVLARVKAQLAISKVHERVAELERAMRFHAEEERKRWRELLQSAPAMIAVLRGPKHVFDLASDMYLRVIGRTAEQVIGRPLLEAIPEVVDQPYPRILDRVYSTGEPYYANEAVVLLDTGGNGALSQRYLNFSYQPWRSANGDIEGIFVHAIDVTDLVLARRLAQEREQQVRTLSDSIPALVWSCLPDGNCDFLSRQWVEYTGIPEEEQLQLNWVTLALHPDDRQRVLDAWLAAVQDQGPYDLEYRLRRHDGVYRWFKTRGRAVRNPEGKIVKWFGTCVDIEDQLNAAQEREVLLQREQSARATAERLNQVGPALVAELDPQRLVQRVTDIATELVGAEFGSLFHNVVSESGESYMLYTLSGVPRERFSHFPMPRNTSMFGPTFRGEGVVLSEDVLTDPRYGKNPPYFGMPEGHLPVRSYLAVPVTSRTGTVIGGLFFGHPEPGKFHSQHADLVSGIAAQAAIALDNANLFAEAQRSRAALQQTNDELRQANTDLEQFAFAAAHDLQEPLRLVTTFSEMIARRLSEHSDNKVATYVRYVTTASQRMTLLLQDLLAYTETSRQSDLDPEAVDLNEVLEIALANLESVLRESGARVEAAKLPHVLGRPSNFIQLFQNLIANAIKYRKPDTAPEVRISATTEDSRASLRVQDNGIGIEPQYHRQIFGVFKRLHGNEIPGTGIGLAICQRVVERAGGRIWVESEPGKGSVFCIDLPLASASTTTESARRAANDR